MRLILWSYACIIALRACSCASIKTPTNITVDHNSKMDTALGRYVPDPDGRGTVSLVISCLLTLILCVWSALHLNVPKQAEATMHYLLVNIRWIITGFYAPELVVFTAWRQWSSAKILSSLVKDLDQSSLAANSTLASRRRHAWTMTHSFFASTGGFVFEIDEDNHQPFLPVGCPKRLALTARGMALLARCGLLPEVSEAEITDKSKANDVAKALVLLQASWMLVQVIED